MVAQRLVFLCVGGISREGNYRERQNAIKARLRSLTSSLIDFSPSEKLVDLLTRVSVGLSNAGVGPRESVSTIDSGELNALLTSQGHRCAVCGIPLSDAVVKHDRHFERGIELVGQKSLEHIYPFQLFGNRTPFEVLCLSCNGCKKERMGWHEDGPVVCGNAPLATLSPNFRRRIHFWTLYRNRKCAYESCSVSSAQSVLYVQESLTRDSTFGAMQVMCSEHAHLGSKWLHIDRYLEDSKSNSLLSSSNIDGD